MSALLATASRTGGSAEVYAIAAGLAALGAIVNGSVWYWLRNRASSYRLNRLRIATCGCAVMTLFSLVRVVAS
jgi:hypothetical protein